ncbi:MAG: ATP-NAD kinase family protein, partial [Desulfobacterales bacterium]|nr:ATP-NAD kinase family protein [Desulfobacterales bacterium]
GRVGLKGTDGLVDRALALGAIPRAGAKAARALACLDEKFSGALELGTPAGAMGADVARDAGVTATPVPLADFHSALNPNHSDPPPATTPSTRARDTRQAARTLVEMGVDLILFAGGDGTARDVCEAVGPRVPVIGIPAGVKIHSPVFARTPEAAGELAALFLAGQVKTTSEQEVLDIDEDAYREGRVTTRLFGYLMVPDSGTRTQGRKAGTPVTERAAQNLISLSIVDDMMEDWIYLIGPGTTIAPVMENLGLENSLLGVDIVQNGKLILKDASEAQILGAVSRIPHKIVITPIGGQGYLFGRGNHQFSPRVIQGAGRENIIVGATLQKIGSFRGRPFSVDTGEPETDRLLKGYIRVVTGHRQEMVHPIQ